MSRRRPTIVALLSITLAWTPSPVRCASDPRVPRLQIELALHDAVFPGDTPGDRAGELLLLLRRDEAGWLTAWGTARELFHDVHDARVVEGEWTGRDLRVRLAATLRPDARGSGGGLGDYEVAARRGEGGELHGSFSGRFRGAPVSGLVTGSVLPPLSPLPDGFSPPRPDEHPRILFRASDLPRLRRRAQTPLGRAALAAMEGPVGLALRYRLLGDEDDLRAVRPLVEQLMARGLVSDQYGNNVGERLETTALAYDICHDAWPEGFRRRVESYLLWAAEGVLDARRDTNSGVNWHVASNWSAPLYAGAGFAGLALWGRKGPPPSAPRPTSTGARVAPAAGYRPGPGVPVFDLRSDAMPEAWIFAGGFPTNAVAGDPLSELGGRSRSRPAVGDAVEFGGETFAFAPLPEDEDRGFWRHANYEGGRLLIDVTNAIGRRFFTTSFFYCVLRSDRPRWVRFESGPHAATLHLGGTRLEPGEVASLAPGLYPFLVEVYIDQINPWGRQLIRPRLVVLPEEEAAERVRRQRARHEAALARHEERRKEWERLGGLDLAARDLFERGRHMMYVFCREAVGDGGFQSELTHYSGIAEKAPARYMSAHRRMFGHAVSPQEDMEALLPRKMFVHVYPDDSAPRAVEINGTPAVGSELMASLIDAVRPAWRPAVLWGWHRHVGFDGTDWTPVVGKRPVWSFLGYPLDLEPAPPAGRLPLSWRADDFGFYGFRDRWRDGDDCVLQVFARAHHLGGWNAPNAGTFRLVGLGHVWAGGSSDRNRHRWEESVVQLPDAPGIRENANGRVTCVSTARDGSGVVSIDYADVYSGRRLRPDGRRAERPYTRYGNIRRDAAFVDLGIRGGRSIGVDFSGRSGAPCLLAIVDRVRGGGRKVWTWQLSPPSRSDPGDVARTETDGAEFRVRKGDGASLHGRLITGQHAVARVHRSTMKGRAGSSAGKTLERPIHGLFAESKEDDVDFFLVATLQRGEAPRIEARGEGLDAVVTVGGVTVRYDGERVVFAPADRRSARDARQPPRETPPGKASALDRLLGEPFRCVGTVRPRHARDIHASSWSVGAETMDRDYTVYASWRRFLGPLGAKKARIQSGWAKTERRRGVYDWRWVDEIVSDMVAQGVEPWVCLCYGNPVYPGGGDTGLGGGLVSSEEALQAWDRYVDAFVARFGDRVDEWEIWNEPRTGRGAGAVQYARFVARTARVIRRRQPGAQILFAAGGSFDTPFAKQALEHFDQQGELPLVDAVIYHPYALNPDSRYGAVEALRRVAASASPRIGIRQGENGAPSRAGGFGAIADAPWTERSQAKWALRRLLGDLGRDIPSSYFAICDMRYPTRTNYKGLLAINEDRTVHHAKQGYRAVQHLTALFDDEVCRATDLEARVSPRSAGSAGSAYSAFGYRRGDRGDLLTLWRSSDRPGARSELERVDLDVSGARLASPVWIDLLSGRAYAIDGALWTLREEGGTIRSVPVYDSPVVIAERAAVADRLAPLEPPTSPSDLVLQGEVTIGCDAAAPGVRLATRDLAHDLERVLETAPSIVESGDATIAIALDPSVGHAEGYRLVADTDRLRILGADELGAIHGIYRLCREHLGVDPYWYFKDLEPERLERVRIPTGVVRSRPPTFRYRGWFVNDEDLLTGWKEGGGRRDIDYPFYREVVPVEVADRVFEALLRAGGNLVIPASFVDVRNEPEARLVRRAVERGLHVSQHHIEPLGVSHYAFEGYWRTRGQQVPFAYGSHPDRVRAAWREFARRWHELAGDRVVWQLGLRGKGDRAIWASDASVSAERAGDLISRAIAEQWEIVREVDPRPAPPATVTLWAEGSRLMRDGRLRLPPGVTIVFCDDGPSQQMQADFERTPREAAFSYGAYYHVAYWNRGPHLIQGTTPRRIRTELDRIVARGDTELAILNVCNVREHVLGIQAATELLVRHDAWSEPEFWSRFAPELLHEHYQILLEQLVPLDDGRILQDGALFSAARRMLESYAKGRREHHVLGASTAASRARQLGAAIEMLDRVVERYPAEELPTRHRPFHDIHLLTQARMLREAFAFYRAVINASAAPERLVDATRALERLLRAREAAATGRWAGWYRGDRKVNVPSLVALTRRAADRLRRQPPGSAGGAGSP